MNLSTYLRTTGRTIPSLAAEVGVSAMAIRYWIERKRIPRAEAMARIAVATGGLVQPNDFFRVSQPLTTSTPPSP